MRVKDKKAPRWGVHPARQRAIGSTHTPLAPPARGRGLAGAARNTVAAVVAGILGAGGLAVSASAHAQDAQNAQNAQSTAPLAAAPASAEPVQSLETVVVTATATQVRKLDASYNIVSASMQQIAMANPASTAEIYKLSPGVWPEASGGPTGVNIDVAGFPNGGGDSPYFTTMIEGTPLYGSPFLSFMDNSSLMRMDDTVERVEIVQGGTSAIFGPGQPGATANFILRTGGDQPKGSIGVTYGSEGLYRTDLFDSGKLTDGWYGSIGGYYEKSDGIRPPQWPDVIGGQLTATLKHDLDHGSIMFWARTLHEHDQWVADFPYTVVNGSIHTYPGFDQLNSTYNSNRLENFQVPNPACNCFENDNIAAGRGADLNYFGSQLRETLGNGFSISNFFIFDGGSVPTHALINNGNPEPLGVFIGLTPPNSQQSGVGIQTLPAPLTPADITATYDNGQPVSMAQSVLSQQVWYVQKKIVSAIDEFRVNKEMGFGNTLTFGVYLARYAMNDNWSLGSNVLITNQPNASAIILTGNAGGNTYQVSSPQGIVSANGGYQILQNGRATNIAPYISDSWKIGRLLLDAGVRVEHINLSQATTNLSPVQMGTAFDLWDNAVELPNGTYSTGHENNTIPTFSVGANYEFSDHMSAYVRINNGVLLDNFDAVRCNVYNGSNGCPATAPLQTVQNQEFGFKVQSSFALIDASIYHKSFKGISYTPTDLGGQPIGPGSVYGSTSIGGRFDGSVNPFASSSNDAVSSFRIAFNAIYERAHYKDFLGCFVYTNILNQQVCGTINGNQLARLPKFQLRLIPSDTQSFGWGTLTEQITYENIGKRFQDGGNLTPLPSYYDIGFGIDALIGEHLELRVLGSNITNQIGLTEGNARFGGNTVQNNVGFGRSILGREVNVTAKYSW